MTMSAEYDEDHEEYTKEGAEFFDNLLATLGVCMTADDCAAEEVPAEYTESGAADITISCGATKLVAGFAALALAATM